MASKSFRYLIDFSIAVLSSVLLILSFPQFDLGFLAWVGLLPLLIVINGKSLKYSFLLSLICGAVFFFGVFYWILKVPKYADLHESLLALYLGCCFGFFYFGSYFGFFGLVYTLISKRLGTTHALLAAPFIWVSLEYIRSNLSFLSLPWALVAHSQYQYSVIIQIASTAGTYSISFLIVLVNAALASLILGRSKSPFPYSSTTENTPSVARGALLTLSASLIGITLIYGYVTVSTPIAANKVKLSLVQGNIEQVKKWDRRYVREIMKIYADLTEEVSKNRPALIIWPETSTPGAINLNPKLYFELRETVKEAGTHLLLGSAQHQKFGEKGTKTIKYLNSAFLIDPQPKMVKQQRYDKIRLFPFGEYLPSKGIIPWSLINVSGSDHYISGKEFTVFEHPEFRFGVTICWENVFPDLVRRFVKRGAQCIINLTNEAHFGRTAAPYQLLSISVFRAVENGVYVVRCTNTGVSCIIDPHGRIVDRVKDEKGQDIFVRGTMTGWVTPLDSKTIYTGYGDWFPWVAFIGSVVFLIVAWWRGMLKAKVPSSMR
jgi:apolipoprotein N-acyltransferase